MTLATHCPSCGCSMSFALEEIETRDGGLVMRTVACPKCGYASEIGRLTVKGVEYRGRIAVLRAKEQRVPSEDRELERLLRLYQREMVTA